MNNLPSREEIERLRQRYPAGTQIRLNHMDDPFAPVPPGTVGEVTMVDDGGNIHMRWQNGRSLSLIEEADDFTVIGRPGGSAGA